MSPRNHQSVSLYVPLQMITMPTVDSHHLTLLTNDLITNFNSSWKQLSNFAGNFMAILEKIIFDIRLSWGVTLILDGGVFKFALECVLESGARVHIASWRSQRSCWQLILVHGLEPWMNMPAAVACWLWRKICSGRFGSLNWVLYPELLVRPIPSRDKSTF